jgi:hypothetical protein
LQQGLAPYTKAIQRPLSATSPVTADSHVSRTF